MVKSLIFYNFFKIDDIHIFVFNNSIKTVFHVQNIIILWKIKLYKFKNIIENE